MKEKDYLGSYFKNTQRLAPSDLEIFMALMPKVSEADKQRSPALAGLNDMLGTLIKIKMAKDWTVKQQKERTEMKKYLMLEEEAKRAERKEDRDFKKQLEVAKLQLEAKKIDAQTNTDYEQFKHKLILSVLNGIKDPQNRKWLYDKYMERGELPYYKEDRNWAGELLMQTPLQHIWPRADFIEVNPNRTEKQRREEVGYGK